MDCSIHHFAHLCVNGVLENLIRLLTLEKNTKVLSLFNKHGKGKRSNVLRLPANTFSHPKLATLFLHRYDLVTAHAFKECQNLKILKLEGILVEFDVLNIVIASCPFLKVLALNAMWYNEKTSLKIHNNNIEVLHLDCPHVDCIDVSAALLDIFSIFYFTFGREQNFVINAPRLLFNNWTKYLERVSNMNYNITSHAQVQVQAHIYVYKMVFYIKLCWKIVSF